MKYYRMAGLVLAALLALTGCSSQKPAEDTQGDLEKETVTAEETAASEVPFTVYCSDELTAAFLQQFQKEYPEVLLQVETATEEMLAAWTEGKTGEGLQAPDMIVVSSDRLGEYAQAGLLTELTSLGISEKDTENMYSFMKELGIEEGKLYGLTWQQTARAFVYNRSLAKKYLEVENNDDMQAAIGEWSGLYNAAEKINSSSEGKVKLLASSDEVWEAFLSANPQWYVEDTLVVPDVMVDLLERYPALIENELTWSYAAGSEEWLSALAEGSAVGCFGDAVLIQEGLAPYFNKDNGDWGFCYGPQNYVTEADMIAVTKECQDTELAAELLEYLTCDKEALETFARAQLLPVNHTEVMEALSEGDTGKYGLLKNQNILKGYTNVAGKISTKEPAKEDLELKARFIEEVEACISGEKNIEQALADFAKAVEQPE